MKIIHQFIITIAITLSLTFQLYAQNDEPGLVSVSPNTAAIHGKAGNQTGLPQPVLGAPIGVIGTGSNRGVYGGSNGGTGVFAASITNYGIWAQSQSYRGITGRTGRNDNNYGFYTPDNIYAANLQISGALLQVVQNTGSQALSEGDVVSMNGINRALEVNDAPVLQVKKTDSANSTAVMGVVHSRIDIDLIKEDSEQPRGVQPSQNSALAPRPTPGDGAALPGDYLLVVVLGPAKVKTTAQAALSLRPGDLLSTASTAGYAQKASTLEASNGTRFTVPGTVFAKTLESSPDKDNLMYVYVTLK